MPTLFSHPAVPIALGLAAGSQVIPPRLLLAGMVAPLSVKRLFGPVGLPVLVTELQWVWLPSLLLVTAFYLGRRLNSR